MKKYKVKLNRDFAAALDVIIAEALETIYPGTDDDKLFLAALAEVKYRLCQKLVEVKPKYTISFTAVQALGLRMLHAEYRDFDSYNLHSDNRLHQLANEIHQHYSN